MRSGIAVALAGLFVLAGGCASPAHYVEKKADAGVVAIPANTNAWPNFNRREALTLIEKHVGPSYEIVEEREVVTGQSTATNQQVNTEPVANRRNPALPGERQTAASTTTQRDLTEWRIMYRRRPGPAPGINGGTPPSGVMQTGGVPPQGAGLTPGVMPSVLPGGGPTGPTSYFAPSSRPGPGGACSS